MRQWRKEKRVGILYPRGENVCKISFFIPLSSDFLVTKWASKECELCDELYKMQLCKWYDVVVLCLIQERCLWGRCWEMVSLKKRGNFLSLQLIRYLVIYWDSFSLLLSKDYNGTFSIRLKGLNGVYCSWKGEVISVYSCQAF